MTFTNKDLKNMIIPLFFEQLLVMLVGIVDTFIVSFVGESAVSGVSLVNSFNTIFINLFTTLASDGAVVISQYIGRKEEKIDYEEQEATNRASGQLLMFSIVFSFILMILVLIFNESLLRLLFGRVENSVMQACITYLRISAYSYPALAIYNAGAALYRSMAKTSTTMYISIASNIINCIGNCIGVFVLHAGVAGVAYPSLIARVFSAVVITFLCFNKTLTTYYEKKHILVFDAKMLKRVLNIAVPNGIEQGIFQLVKVALSSVVALFGTYQIAANGVAQSIWSLAALVGVAMGPVFITVIGQCMGAKDIDNAHYYFKKLMKITVIFSIIWNVFILLITPLFLQYYQLSSETKHLVFVLVIIHNIFNTIAFPFSGPLSNGLRAAGDVKYNDCINLKYSSYKRNTFYYIWYYIQSRCDWYCLSNVC